MLTSHRSFFPAGSAVKAPVLTGTLLATSLFLSAAHAAGFGHSRILSAPGQALHVEIPVTDLTQADIESLRAVPAPAQAWQQAGMTPPVPLESMRLVLLDGYRPGVKVIQLRSDQPANQPIVDVLLDVRSASGQQRYQVSLLAHADTQAVQRPGAEAGRQPRVIDGRAPSGTSATHSTAGTQIRVRAGDTMFSIAQRNAVHGVSVYQMMIALHRANPHAFISENVNLVRAGESLTMPDLDALTAISDREARRIFQQHAQAFAKYRQRSGGADVAAVSTGEAVAAQGTISESTPAPAAQTAVPASGDRLKLSGGAEAGQGVAGSAPGNQTASTSTAGGVSGPSGTGAQGIGAQSGSDAQSEGGIQTGTAGQGADGAQAAVSGPASANGQAGVNGQVASANGQVVGAANGPSAPTNLLANSGAIASDAVPHDHASGQTGATGTGATGTGSAHPDDEAATRKNIEESRGRIVELEDNVRHLNEALQKQGHVAAEAALEGARSVTEAIKEAIGLTDDPATQAHAGASGGDAAADTGSTGAAASGGAPGAPAASGDASGAAPGQPGASSQSAPGAASAPSGNAAGASTAQATAPATVSAGSSVQPPSSSSAAPAAAAPAVSKGSWFQENLLLTMGGGLLLLILVVVWILRRVGASERAAFESDSPITDSMVREKLREIDLELDSSRPSGSGRPGV